MIRKRTPHIFFFLSYPLLHATSFPSCVQCLVFKDKLLLQVNIDTLGEREREREREGAKDFSDAISVKTRFGWVERGERRLREGVHYLETVTVRDNKELCSTLTFYLYKDFRIFIFKECSLKMCLGHLVTATSITRRSWPNTRVCFCCLLSF